MYHGNKITKTRNITVLKAEVRLFLCCFVFTARCYADRRYVVCLSGRPSVTLSYRQHIGWNS